MDKKTDKCVGGQSSKGNKLSQPGEKSYNVGMDYAFGANKHCLDLGMAYTFLNMAAEVGHKKAKRIIDKSHVIAGRHIIIPEQLGDCIKVYSRLSSQMAVTANRMGEYFVRTYTSYKEMRNLYAVYKSFINDFYNNDVGELLNAFDIDIENDDFFTDLPDTLGTMPSDIMWEQLFEGVNKIRDKFENLKKTQKSRPSSYGTFVGGGSNIRGAIVGSVKASLLNFAIDAAAGAINNASDRNKLLEIEKELNAIYDKLIKSQSYIFAFIYDCRFLIACIIDELMKRGKLYEIDTTEWVNLTSNEEVSEIEEKGKTDKEFAISELLDRIEKKPYDIGLYSALYEVDPDIFDEIYKFMQEYQMEYYLLSKLHPNDPKYKFYKFPPFSLDH